MFWFPGIRMSDPVRQTDGKYLICVCEGVGLRQCDLIIRMSVVWRWEPFYARWTCILRGRASFCIGFFAYDTCMVIRLPCTYLCMFSAVRARLCISYCVANRCVYSAECDGCACRECHLHCSTRWCESCHWRLSSWCSWCRGTLVSLTDCRWWFDSPLVASKTQDRRPAERQRARTKKKCESCHWQWYLLERIEFGRVLSERSWFSILEISELMSSTPTNTWCCFGDPRNSSGRYRGGGPKRGDYHDSMSDAAVNLPVLLCAKVRNSSRRDRSGAKRGNSHDSRLQAGPVLPSAGPLYL